ncbi:MAG TPA: phage tail tip lysozyme [Polyangiaceae bacterium]|nr:phage tail tip lysozyme [Polyangiaceae bacterium]
MGFVSASRRGIVLVVAVAFAISCSVLGCSSGPEPLGQNEAALFGNDQSAYDFFVGKGLTSFQAAGIVGNLDQESGVSPTAVQQGGPGRGIAQWSTGGRWDTDSGDNAVWYAGKQGLSVWSLQLQLEFIWYELQNISYYGLAALKATTNVTDATVAFETDFEGCGTCLQSTRVSYAKSVLAAYGSAAYGAQFVSQSFPLASTTLTMVAGEVIPSYIELKNTGTKTWDSNTRIGTTQPRDRTSAFADETWLAPNRPAAVKGTVAPGATYKFTFDLAAPNEPGTYDEFFGVVEESVAWFSDPGQGGPVDNDLEVKIVVVPNDGGVVPPTGDAGKVVSGDAGKSDAGAIKGDGGWSDPPGQYGGCDVGRTPSAPSPRAGFFGLLLALGLFARSRQRAPGGSSA